MLRQIRKLDSFSKNIVIVFAGIALVHLFNLLYQLLIAHKLSTPDFAAFNSLLSIFMVISVPLSTIGTAVAKYSAEFNARNQVNKIRFLLSDLLKKTSLLALFTFFIFWLASPYIINTLRIPTVYGRYIFPLLIASAWISPVFSGAVQGLELFRWLTAASVITGGLKLALAFLLILFGFNIASALGALLASILIGLVIYYAPVRHFISLKSARQDIEYKEMLSYLFPVAISNFCFIALVNLDMVVVKYFFTGFDSGLYSLAHMVGKIFLFLPAAISIVLFPRTSGLKAQNLGTFSTLKKSLFYVFGLCICAALIYNLFPAFILKLLTGKAYPESISLGRLFSISMSFFSVLYILIFYLLSIKDLRFVKYLVGFTFLQFLTISLLHQSLAQVQLVLCVNAILLFSIHLGLAYKECRVKQEA
ncbi:MAG: oligosaccharide flippase family protein [Candidatus Omnitrophota bacterium]|jgi:O-antigen/teichoic acid export membrane protein